MQNYLKANDISQEEVLMIFKMRSRMADVKTIFRNKNETLDCDLCKNENESQRHILECKEILKRNKYRFCTDPRLNKVLIYLGI